MFHALRTVIYKVDNLQKAKAWYTSILEKEPYFDQPYYVGYDVGGFELGLDPDTSNVTIGSNVVAYWKVEDAYKIYQDLLSKGGRPGEELKDVGEGILVGTVIDPCGNVFGIIEERNLKQ